MNTYNTSVCEREGTTYIHIIAVNTCTDLHSHKWIVMFKNTSKSEGRGCRWNNIGSSVVLRTSVLLIVHYQSSVITVRCINSQYVSLQEFQWSDWVVLMDIRVTGFIWSEEAEVNFVVAVPSPNIPPPYLELWSVITTTSQLSSHYPLGDGAIASKIYVWEKTQLLFSSLHSVNVYIQCLPSQVR